MSDWRAVLDDGEQLVWQGVPTRRLFVFRLIDLFFIPFLLVWVSMPATILISGPSGIFLALPLLFVAVAAWGLIGRFLWDAWRRRGTTYALTDSRAIILHSRPVRVLREQPLHGALPITLKGGDRGSVVFGDGVSPFSPSGMMSVWTGDDGSFSFRGIDDPAEVYRLARAAIRA